MSDWPELEDVDRPCGPGNGYCGWCGNCAQHAKDIRQDDYREQEDDYE